MVFNSRPNSAQLAWSYDQELRATNCLGEELVFRPKNSHRGLNDHQTTYGLAYEGSRSDQGRELAVQRIRTCSARILAECTNTQLASAGAQLASAGAQRSTTKCKKTRVQGRELAVQRIRTQRTALIAVAGNTAQLATSVNARNASNAARWENVVNNHNHDHAGWQTSTRHQLWTGLHQGISTNALNSSARSAN